MGINTPKIGNNSIDSMLNDEKLKNDFIEQMQLITKETGITLNIDTSNQGVARMIPGKKGVFFNPVFTLNLMKQIAEKREKELGIKSDFEFDIKHLSALVLHEINHMINRNDLKKSDKQIKFDGKTMNMAEYEKALHDKYGLDFNEFENRLEDIDVNNLATKIQAPIYENPKKEIYQNICIPDSDFSQNPLHEQLGRAALRESMIEYEKCTVDPMVRDILDYIGESGGLLEIIRDPQLKYDEQLPAIAKLYEEYYLPLKKEAENQEKQNQNKQENQDSNSEQQNQQQDQNPNSEQQNQQQNQSSNSEQQNQQQDQNPNSEQQNQQQDQNPNSEQQNQQQDQNSNSEQQDQQQDQNPNSEQQNQQQNQSSAKTGQQKSHARPMSLPHIFDDLESQLEDMAQNEDQKENDGKEPQNNSHDEKKTNNETKEQKENEKNNKDKSIFDKLKDKIKDALGRKKDQQKDNTQKQLEDLLNDKKHEDTVNNPENDTDTSEKNNESDEISDELMRQFNERLEKQEKEKNKTPEDRQLEESIKQERGTDDENEIEQIKRQLEQQEEILKKIKQIKDKEGNSVYDKITEEIFKKIVNFRKYRSIYEKSPQPFSGGGQLSPHALVGGIMDWKNGDDDPRIMQQEKIEEKEKKKAGSFSITFILDGSSSMKGEKNIQQKLSTLIMLYALQQINDDLKSDEYSDMENFAVESQVMMFEGSNNIYNQLKELISAGITTKEELMTQGIYIDNVKDKGGVDPLKQRGKDLTKKDIIEITDKLDYCDGWDTNATDAIKLYYDQICKPFNDMSSEEYEERKEKVKSGEKKEIVFVLSDGDFNSGGDPQGYIQKMREMGIIVCGIGITNEGKNIINYFGKKTDDPEKDKLGFGIICKNANDLGATLNDLLVHHLSDPMIIGE